jgi:phospholipid/cholesterol/gamma-HCH transport system substrate-binding protein
MNDRSLRLRLGLFVLIALVLLATLIVLFGSLPTYFSPAKLYSIRFTDAPGVSTGTPVRRSGVRIGAVRSVTLDDEREIVRVLIAIDARYTLRHNEQATLSTSLLGSDASIDFVPQTPEEGQPVDRSAIEPGAEIVGILQASVNTLLNRASEVVPTTQETLDQMRKSLQRLERLAPLSEDTLREYRDLARETRAMIPDLKRTNTEVQQLARESRQALPDLRNAANDLAATSRIYGRLGERLDLLLQTNQDKIVKALDNANEVLNRLVSLLSDENIRNVTAITRNTRQASDRFDSIARNLDETLKETQKAATRLNDTLVQADKVLRDTSKVTGPLGERGERIASNLDAVLENTRKITGPLAERADPIARNLDASLASLQKTLGPFSVRSDRMSRDLEQTLSQLNRTLGDVNALMRVIDQADGTLRRFLVDPSLYIHMDEVICAVGRLTPQLQRILKDFEAFADKVARHPESLGIGGVVRPGSGLKDPPTPPYYPGGPP